MITIQITGADKLKLALSRASITINGQVKTALADTAQQIAEKAKQNCPVKTGRLRDSITVEISADGMSAAVGSHVAYALIVEYGQCAKPFLNPAFEEEAPTLATSILNKHWSI